MTVQSVCPAKVHDGGTGVNPNPGVHTMGQFASAERSHRSPPAKTVEVQALFDGRQIARSRKTQLVEGRHYFPPSSVDPDALSESSKAHTFCSWKGEAHYWDVKGESALGAGAAWSYPEPKQAAKHIAGFIAFGPGVTVQVVKASAHEGAA